MQVKETTLSRLAAAFFTLGHFERKKNPCLWFRIDGVERGTFFFERGQKGPDLDLEAAEAAFMNPDRADTESLEKLLALVPKEHHALARKLFRTGQVAFFAKATDNYKHHTMALLNRSKKEQGMSFETRGRRVFFAGRKADERKIAELRQEAKF
jgi:hypothetical protein